VVFGGVKRWISVPCFVGLIMASELCAAGLDLNLSGNARSYPLSGVIEAQSGYGVVLYGEEGSPFAGYVRVAVDGASAGTYNSGGARVEIFPLGILGVRGGGESIQNDKDYTAYDCEVYACQGRFYRTYVEGELTLGYSGLFAQGRWRRERWTQPKESQSGDFADPTSGLLMSATGESQTVYQALLGYKWNEAWTIMAGLRYASDDDGISQMPFGILRWTSGGFSLGLGGGAFKSALKDRESMAIGFFSWDIWPSVKLK
jgi:hypothetical protein